MSKFWNKIKKPQSGNVESSKARAETVDKSVSPKISEEKNNVTEEMEERTYTVTEKVSKTAEPLKEKTKVWTSGVGEKVCKVAKIIVNKTKKLVSLVGQKAPEVAETVADKTKTLASVVSEKTGEAVIISKLKIRLHNLNSNVDKMLLELGGIIYELFKQSQKDVYEDKEVIALIEKLKSLHIEIKVIEKEIEEMSADKKKIDHVKVETDG